MNADAKQVLKSFYLKLRREHHSSESAPITTRQLESLIRLSEARARAELRTEVTAQDANDVVEIVKESMYDVFSDNLGHVDYSRGRGTSQQNQARRLVKAFRAACRAQNETTFSEKALYDVARRSGIEVDDFRALLETLNQQGVLLRKPNRHYQVVGVVL